MKNFTFLLFFVPGLLFAQSESAGAGNEGGNGGDVIICKNGGRTEEPVLLDYFESNIKVKITGPEDAFEKVRIILNRVAKHDPVRARLYSEGLRNFIAETIFIPNFSLPDISDEGWIHARSRHQLSVRCVKKQAVIQIWRPDLNENYQSWSDVRPKRYFIDQNLWNKLDSTNKAGLIIHELLVREGVNLLGTDDTRDIRKLNRYWSSPNLIHNSTSDYEYKIQKLGFEVLRK